MDRFCSSNEIVLIRDEQVVASVIVLASWTKLLPTFIDTFYRNFANALSANSIIWQRDDTKGLAELARKYPKYFRWNKTYLEYLPKDHNLAFNAFLETLPKSVQDILAIATKKVCGGLR